MHADRTRMVARLYSFATLSDEEEPTKKAPFFLAAYARDFEDAGDTAVRQVHTVPMARPPVRGPGPASEAPAAPPSGVVRCLTPVSMAASIVAFRAEAANEVTMAPGALPAPITARARACRAVAAGLLAGAALVALCALGVRTPRLADAAPRVAVIEAASPAHDAPRAKLAPRPAPAAHGTVAGPPAPLPVPPGKRGRLVRSPPF